MDFVFTKNHKSSGFNINNNITVHMLSPIILQPQISLLGEAHFNVGFKPSMSKQSFAKPTWNIRAVSH